ncbi:MAG: type II secretion system GspH family protein [Desulfobacterales bacterium]|nr:type II secretion system GspH family protein [Desulfobacterales bacterium]
MKKSKFHTQPVMNDEGFTLIEIIAVLVILSIIGTFAVSRVSALDATAVEKSFAWVESELNSRETLTWSKLKISDGGWVDDESLFAALDLDMGRDYSWSVKTGGGGALTFRGKTISVERSPSTSSRPATWKIK